MGVKFEDEKMRKYIGQQLRNLRQDRNWSIEYVGEKMGLHESTISSHERGRTEPDGPTLVRYCLLYGVDISYFYYIPGRQDDRAKTPNELKLLAFMRELDDLGQNRLLEYASDLVASGNYSRKGGSATSIQAS